MSKSVCVSGYFNPIHDGHLDLLEAAATYGHLTVIVNNDWQVSLKGSVPFYDEKFRMRLLKCLKPVKAVILSIDTDNTVCKTLQLIKPKLFINSGDRNMSNSVAIERDICKEIGCQYLTLNQPKRNSSSKLIENAAYYYSSLIAK